MVLRLTQRDMRLLEVLTWCLRIASAKQLANCFCQSCPDSFQDRLRRLEAAQWLHGSKNVLRVPKLTKPLATWHPDSDRPDFAKLAWQLRKRATSSGATRTQLYWSTKQAAELTGGIGGRLRQPFQVEHDLGTAAIFYHKWQHNQATGWQSEDIFRRDFTHLAWSKIPDAVLVDGANRVCRMIEYGGHYSAERLQQLRHFGQQQQLAIELW